MYVLTPIKLMFHILNLIPTFIYLILYFNPQVTWADLMFVSNVEMFVTGHGFMPEYENLDALKNHSTLAEYKASIENLPNIKTWIEKRPVTPF